MQERQEKILVHSLLSKSLDGLLYAVGVNLACSSLRRDELAGWVGFAKALVSEYVRDGNPLDTVTENRVTLSLAYRLCDFYIARTLEDSEETISTYEVN